MLSRKSHAGLHVVRVTEAVHSLTNRSESGCRLCAIEICHEGDVVQPGSAVFIDFLENPAQWSPNSRHIMQARHRDDFAIFLTAFTITAGYPHWCDSEQWEKFTQADGSRPGQHWRHILTWLQNPRWSSGATQFYIVAPMPEHEFPKRTDQMLELSCQSIVSRGARCSLISPRYGVILRTRGKQAFKNNTTSSRAQF